MVFDTAIGEFGLLGATRERFNEWIQHHRAGV
jgi:hypothetical protein